MEEEKRVRFGAMKFTIPPTVELTTVKMIGDRAWESDSLRFRSGTDSSSRSYTDYLEAFDFCADILNGIAESVEFQEHKPENFTDLYWEVDNFYREVAKKRRETIRAGLAKLVEEKFGMKVRVCANCRFFEPHNTNAVKTYGAAGYCAKSSRPSRMEASVSGFVSCINRELNGVLNAWEPKEA